MKEALRGLIETKSKLQKTHDLYELGAGIGLPEELLGRCEGLTLAYIETRYPDQYVKYEREDAERDFAIAEEVLKWVSERIS